MTAALAERLERLEKAATPGPWELFRDGVRKRNEQLCVLLFECCAPYRHCATGSPAKQLIGKTGRL